MSRVGLKEIPVPTGVSVQVEKDHLKITGPKGELTTPVPRGISFEQEEGVLRAQRAREDKQTRAFHGLARALAANAVYGVTEGYEVKLAIHGIGYRAKMEGSKLILQVGFSHQVEFEAPEGVSLEVEDTTRIKVIGIDKQMVGEIAAQIRRIRPPDPYKGKGIRYADEVIRKKVGKANVGSM